MGTLDTLSAQFEQASLRYAEANHIARTEEWFVLKLQEELGEMTQAWMKQTGRGRPKERTPGELRRAVEDECADLLGHVLLFAWHNGIDLSAAIERKWRFAPA